MTELRHKDKDYVGNQLFRGINQPNMKFCFGCDNHRPSAGGRMLGKLRLFNCIVCVARRNTTKGTS